MREFLRLRRRSDLTTRSLALYFVLLPLDFIPVRGMGSVSKFIALIPILCFLFETRLRIPYWRNKTSRWLIAFSSLAVISLLYTISFEKTGSTVLTLLLNVVFIIILADCRVYSVSEREYLKEALVLGSIISAALSVGMMLTGSGGYYGTGRYTMSVGDVSQDPNYFCGYLLFGFAYFLSRGFSGKPILNFGAALLFIFVSLLSGSRGGFLAFIVCGVMVLLLSARRKDRMKLLLISAAGLVMAFLFIRFVLPLMNADILNRFSLGYIITHGTTNRYHIWESLFSNFKDASIFRKFFGHGYGTCEMLTYDGLHAAHNLYIDNLLTLGIAGVSLQIGFQVSGLRTAIRNRSYYCLSILLAMICMCMSLSLLSYKPLWAVITMILIENNSRRYVEDEAEDEAEDEEALD